MRRRSILALVVAGVAVSIAIGGARPASAATDQLRDSAVTTYTLQPDRRAVHVSTAFTLTNRAPSRSRSHSCTQYYFDPYQGYVPYTTTCRTRTDYYYDRYDLWTEPDATNLRVKANTGSASVKRSATRGDWRKTTINFSRLFYGKTRKLTLTYDLPAGGPRSTAERRVGYGFAKFCAAGPGTDTGALRVVVPAGFEMTVDDPMQATTSGGLRTYSTGTLKQPWKFFTCFSGTNDDGYVTTPVTTSAGDTVTVEAWQDDPTWSKAVASAVERGLPALTTLLGPLGDSSSMTIREEVAGGLWADTYDAAGGRLRLSESVAAEPVVTHRLATLWFDDVLAAPWLRDGYASWAEHEAGISDAPCDRPGPFPGPGEPNLAVWIDAAPGASEADKAKTAYQQQAACFVVSSIADAMGPDRMRETLEAMRERTVDYPFGGAPPEPPGIAGRVEWRAWLDAVTEGGLAPAGADAALAADLVGTHALPSSSDTLTRYALIHDRYRQLVELNGVPAPEAVLVPLRSWRFDEAEPAITAAIGALETSAEVEARLAGADVSDGPVAQAVRAAMSSDDLGSASALAKAQLAMAEDVAGALGILDSPRDVLQTVGLVGAELPSPDAAVAAVERADGPAATAISNQIRTTIGAARDVGLQRVAIAFGTLAAITIAGLAISAFVRRRRRRNRPPAPPETTSTV